MTKKFQRNSIAPILSPK